VGKPTQGQHSRPSVLTWPVGTGPFRAL
jgi:hypothetical protein